MALVPTVLGDIFVSDEGGPELPAVFLWPSLFTDHTMWRNQVPELLAAGWRTLTIDPPGHGQSPGVERKFSMDECAVTALQILDWFRISSPVVVLGTSWGGMIAPRMALRAPQRIRAMVLFNTTADSATLPQRIQNKLLTTMLAIPLLDKTVDKMLVSLQLSARTRQQHPEIATRLAQTFRSWKRRTLINTVQAVLIDRDSSLSSLPDVKAPALIVSGKNDTILPAPHSQRIAERLPSARHVEVDDAAHLVPLEVPASANKLLLEFLRSLPDEKMNR